MRAGIVAVLSMLLLLCSAACCQATDVQITKIAGKSPPAGKESLGVDWRPFVEGTCSGDDTTVWVVIHPFEIADFFVEPQAACSDGTWKVEVFFGDKDTPAGKQFEMRAFADPVKQLQEGQRLKTWPKGRARSKVVYLVRQ